MKTFRSFVQLNTAVENFRFAEEKAYAFGASFSYYAYYRFYCDIPQRRRSGGR